MWKPPCTRADQNSYRNGTSIRSRWVPLLSASPPPPGPSTPTSKRRHPDPHPKLWPAPFASNCENAAIPPPPHLTKSPTSSSPRSSRLSKIRAEHSPAGRPATQEPSSQSRMFCARQPMQPAREPTAPSRQGGVAVQIELLEVFDCGGEPAVRDGSCDPSLAQHRDGLDVDQTVASDHGTGIPGLGRTAFFLLRGPKPRSVRGTCVL